MRTARCASRARPKFRTCASSWALLTKTTKRPLQRSRRLELVGEARRERRDERRAADADGADAHSQWLHGRTNPSSLTHTTATHPPRGTSHPSSSAALAAAARAAWQCCPSLGAELRANGGGGSHEKPSLTDPSQCDLPCNAAADCGLISSYRGGDGLGWLRLNFVHDHATG